jgi:hypothetical protein
VNGAFVVENLVDAFTVAEPVEVGAPKETTAFAHPPTAGCGFASERVLVTFADGAGAGAEADRT